MGTDDNILKKGTFVLKGNVLHLTTPGGWTLDLTYDSIPEDKTQKYITGPDHFLVKGSAG